MWGLVNSSFEINSIHLSFLPLPPSHFGVSTIVQIIEAIIIIVMVFSCLVDSLKILRVTILPAKLAIDFIILRFSFQLNYMRAF